MLMVPCERFRDQNSLFSALVEKLAISIRKSLALSAAKWRQLLVESVGSQRSQVVVLRFSSHHPGKNLSGDWSHLEAGACEKRIPAFVFKKRIQMLNSKTIEYLTAFDKS